MTKTAIWPVVPLCKEQLLDVQSKDILEGGLYRICDIYKSGGGYDEFTKIYKKRYNKQIGPLQFVVQLYGCPLKCPYCYVTPSGVFGDPSWKSNDQLITAYTKSKASVFHLMGGAPGLYLPAWKELAEQVDVFHSDLLLVEREYQKSWLKGLPGLIAVSIKEPYIYKKKLDLLHRNLKIVIDSGIDFYITFTGPPELQHSLTEEYGKEVMRDSFNINIVAYQALLS